MKRTLILLIAIAPVLFFINSAFAVIVDYRFTGTIQFPGYTGPCRYIDLDGEPFDAHYLFDSDELANYIQYSPDQGFSEFNSTDGGYIVMGSYRNSLYGFAHFYQSPSGYTMSIYTGPYFPFDTDLEVEMGLSVRLPEDFFDVWPVLSIPESIDMDDVTQIVGSFGILIDYSCNCGCYNYLYDIDNMSFTARPVPEPATMLLLGSGLVGLAGFGRKRLKKNIA